MSDQRTIDPPGEDWDGDPDHPLYTFYYDELKWCGCGDPNTALRFMRDVLSALRARADSGYSEKTVQAVEALLPWSNPLALSYHYMLDGYELTEHGGSVAGAWLSEKEHRILGVLRSVNLEER